MVLLETVYTEKHRFANISNFTVYIYIYIKHTILTSVQEFVSQCYAQQGAHDLNRAILS